MTLESDVTFFCTALQRTVRVKTYAEGERFSVAVLIYE